MGVLICLTGFGTGLALVPLLPPGLLPLEGKLIVLGIAYLTILLLLAAARAIFRRLGPQPPRTAARDVTPT